MARFTGVPLMTMADQIIATLNNAPLCSRCGMGTRIYGVEPHAENEKKDIRTYVCGNCETVEVRVVPALAVN
jgi:hypothetical protein